MTFLQRVHYIWVRAGIVLLIASPIVMYPVEAILFLEEPEVEE